MKIGIVVLIGRTNMAHPQVLKQCQRILQEFLPHLKTISGRDKFIGTAVAKALVRDKLPQAYAILGPKTLRKPYHLQIIKKDLQEDKENRLTVFLPPFRLNLISWLPTSTVKLLTPRKTPKHPSCQVLHRSIIIG